MDRRVLSIGDIHGEYDKLMKLLQKINLNMKEDIAIFHGDYVDRGDQNLAVVYKMMELQEQGAIVLKGNHEWFMAMALHDIVFGHPMYNKPFDLNFWFKNGGSKTYNEIMKLTRQEQHDLFHFIQNLPKYATYGKFIFVHGGVNMIKPLEQNRLDEIVQPDQSFIPCPAYKDKIVVFGHTPTWKMKVYGEPEDKANASIWYDPVNKDKIGIDCGAIFGGRLACLELPSYKEYYVS